ncbi:unnamed protein product [Musa acuminata subsp. malaccensis]|uniref:(wild Malaysian banana) hypothetical protein n=1 Tax=Musa acuminata subsp. malaccensis TaxID=214687 RepID=A0A8D7ABW9_MUSAM|nr:unnamed protein product [Musa acuminata subsp. malaccensis]
MALDWLEFMVEGRRVPFLQALNLGFFTQQTYIRRSILTFSSGCRAFEPIILRLYRPGHGGPRWLHAKLCARHLDLHADLRQAPRGVDGVHEVGLGESGQGGAVADVGREIGAVGDHRPGRGHQYLVVLKPDEHLPGLEIRGGGGCFSGTVDSEA